MMQSMNLSTPRAVLGALLLSFVAACSEGPASPVGQPSAPTSRVSLRTRDLIRLRGELVQTDERTTSTSVIGGTAELENAAQFGLRNTSPVALRVWEETTPRPDFLRGTQAQFTLPDGRVAYVTRSLPEQGGDAVLSVRVGTDEFRWLREFDVVDGRRILRRSVVEARRAGDVVTRQITDVSLSSRRLALATAAARRDARSAARLRVQLLLAANKFGSVAGTVLLPKAAHAQTTQAGMACNGASKALGAAWLTWQMGFPTWLGVLGSGSLFAVVGATTAILAASAAVDVAENNYIDCYVAAAAAGVPDQFIAKPPKGGFM